MLKGVRSRLGALTAVIVAAGAAWLMAASILAPAASATPISATTYDSAPYVYGSIPASAHGDSEHASMGGSPLGPAAAWVGVAVSDVGVAANTVKLTGASGVRALSPGAVAVGENGWSGAGRALAKKLGRDAEAGSWSAWKPTVGDPGSYNAAGEQFLTELAESRALPVLERGRAGTPATWQDLSVYRLPSGQGAAFTADGTFVGLR